jgi:hypothetical protein
MESRTKTPYEMLLINRLPKVTNHPVLQSAGPDVVVGESRHQDRRNRMPGFDEAPVELDTGHRRHMDISDQAGGFDETRDARKSAAEEEASTAKPNDLISLRMDSRKNRSSSTTKINGAFGIPLSA